MYSLYYIISARINNVFQKQCITMNQMSLALNIMVAMKDFSRKWLVVKMRPFTGHFTLQ